VAFGNLMFSDVSCTNSAVSPLNEKNEDPVSIWRN